MNEVMDSADWDEFWCQYGYPIPSVRLNGQPLSKADLNHFELVEQLSPLPFGVSTHEEEVQEKVELTELKQIRRKTGDFNERGARFVRHNWANTKNRRLQKKESRRRRGSRMKVEMYHCLEQKDLLITNLRVQRIEEEANYFYWSFENPKWLKLNPEFEHEEELIQEDVQLLDSLESWERPLFRPQNEDQENWVRELLRRGDHYLDYGDLFFDPEPHEMGHHFGCHGFRDQQEWNNWFRKEGGENTPLCA